MLAAQSPRQSAASSKPGLFLLGLRKAAPDMLRISGLASLRWQRRPPRLNVLAVFSAKQRPYAHCPVDFGKSGFFKPCFMDAGIVPAVRDINACPTHAQPAPDDQCGAELPTNPRSFWTASVWPTRPGQRRWLRDRYAFCHGICALQHPCGSISTSRWKVSGMRPFSVS